MLFTGTNSIQSKNEEKQKQKGAPSRWSFCMALKQYTQACVIVQAQEKKM